MKKILTMTVLAMTVLFSGIFGSIETEAASTNHRIKAADIGIKHIGVKYVYGGTTTKGFDCSGFVGYSFKKAGKTLPRTAAQIYKNGSKVGKSSLKKGDLVFFNTTGKGASHVGIYIGSNKFVHASSSKGVKIDSMSNSYWKKKYLGAKRV